MNTKIFYAIAIAAALLTGYSAYNAHNQQELSDVLLANVEALADNTEESDQNVTTCPNPYDVRDHQLSFTEHEGNYSADVNGEITIAGKKFKIAEANAKIHVTITYLIGDCDKESIGNCCPNSRNGEVKIIKTVFN